MLKNFNDHNFDSDLTKDEYLKYNKKFQKWLIGEGITRVSFRIIKQFFSQKWKSDHSKRMAKSALAYYYCTILKLKYNFK